LIGHHESERKGYIKTLDRFRNEAENSYSFTKYECNKYRQIVSASGVLQECQTLLQKSYEK